MSEFVYLLLATVHDCLCDEELEDFHHCETEFGDQSNAGNEGPSLCMQTVPQSDKRLESVCVSHLMKFKEVHRLSQAAMTDIMEFVKLLHSHYVTKAQAGIAALFEMNEIQPPTMQQLFDCVECEHPLKGPESHYQLCAYMAKELPYVVSDTYSL